MPFHEAGPPPQFVDRGIVPMAHYRNCDKCPVCRLIRKTILMTPGAEEASREKGMVIITKEVSALVFTEISSPPEAMRGVDPHTPMFHSLDILPMLYDSFFRSSGATKYQTKKGLEEELIVCGYSLHSGLIPSPHVWKAQSLQEASSGRRVAERELQRIVLRICSWEDGFHKIKSIYSLSKDG